MPERIELSLLIDYYGAFLTENQRELLELSCDDDLSLSEIAALKGISRQGVRDALARGTKTLCDMNEKLHLIERDRRMADLVKKLESGLASIEELERRTASEADSEECGKLKAKLSEMRELIGRLSQMMG